MIIREEGGLFSVAFIASLIYAREFERRLQASDHLRCKCRMMLVEKAGRQPERSFHVEGGLGRETFAPQEFCYPRQVGI
ncbi:hypothetical protein BURK_007711 [Burkholderia sp. SJ98]|nr:hypothetical protein BURK_007711 [Burkholderia sp. SJ98]